jgi:tetratricopeptide (TPR) repeat protein
MPTPDEKEIDDPSNRKLPPINREPEAKDTPGGWIPTAGVSSKLKIFVIGLTFITVMAFGVFIAIFVKKTFLKGTGNQTWGPQILTIAKELKNKGLRPQAIEHYQKYLDTQKVDMETRSRVSFDIATLYVELGKCDDAVVWFLHAIAAQPEEHRVQKSEAQIQQCLGRSKTSQ